MVDRDIDAPVKTMEEHKIGYHLKRVRRVRIGNTLLLFICILFGAEAAMARVAHQYGMVVYYAAICLWFLFNILGDYRLND